MVVIILACNYAINRKTSGLVTDDLNLVPCHLAGLLPGTNRWLSNGKENLYFRYRIEAAARLYRSGKIKYIIVSGDNHKKEYNEPMMMKEELVRLGVPDSVIIPDYAGFRTFDSVIRCREIFDQTDITIISQKFHNQRAVFIAEKYGIHAIGYNARDVDKYYGFKTRVREAVARVKVFIDLLTGKQPHFLGEKIKIG